MQLSDFVSSFNHSHTCVLTNQAGLGLGLYKGHGNNIGQYLTSASPITIPETIEGHILAPVSFLFLSGKLS